MSRHLRSIASHLLVAVSHLLPCRLSIWARAMERELAEIEDDRRALLFAAGCLRALLGLAIAERLGTVRRAARFVLIPSRPSNRRLSTMNVNALRPRSLVLFCGAAAVGLGTGYMAAAGAPARYLLVNLASLLLGAALWAALGRASRSTLAGAGPAVLALAMPLLATAYAGISIEGASRWISVGPLYLQVSLILLPVMLVLYARRPDPLGTIGMVAAALALAVMPDRAMAGVLLAGLVGLLCAAPGRLPLIALGASALAFGWSLLTPDNLPAVPHVDQVLYTAFDVHPLAGVAVVAGAAMLILPAMPARWSDAEARPALLAFGACWLGVVTAAALGNYPTPLVGFGGSAILGYLLSGALLPAVTLRRLANEAPAATGADADADQPNPELRLGIA